MQTIRDVLKTRDTYWVDAEDSVRAAVRYLCERKTGAVAVMSGGELVGMFSERDVLHRVVNAGLDPETSRVRDVMSTNLITISCNDEIHMAKSVMYKNRVRHLIVLGHEGAFKGLVSIRDLIDADIAESAELIHRLNDRYYEEAHRTKVIFAANRVISQGA